MEKELRFIFDSQFFFQNLKIIINLLHNEKKIICWILKCFIKNIINVFRLSQTPKIFTLLQFYLKKYKDTF